MFRLLLITSLFLLCQNSFSQEGRLLYDINKDGKVKLKWYHQDNIIFPDGCKLYKKHQDSDSWRIIDKVYKKNKETFRFNEKDTSLTFFIEAAELIALRNEKDFAYLNLIIKSFQSNQFANYLGIYYEDNLQSSEGPVKYKVSYSSFGKEIIIAESDYIKINAAKNKINYNLSAKNKGNKVFLKWDTNDDRFYGVDVYRRIFGEKEFTKLNEYPVMIGQKQNNEGILEMPEYFYEDRIKDKNLNYEYKITGKGYFEKDNEFSDVVEVFVKEDLLPLPPHNLERKVSNNKVLLDWENPFDTAYYHINIYQSTKSDGPFIKLNPSPLSTAIEKYEINVEEGNGYYYYVTAENRFGNENRSNKVFAEVADKTPPSSPTQVMIKSDTGVFKIQWVRNEESDLLGYQLFRKVKDDNQGEYMLMNANPILDNVFIDSVASNTKNLYNYYVIAVDSSYNRSDYSQAVSAKLPDISSPESPFIKSIIPKEKGLSVLWNPSYDTDIKSYTLIRHSEQDTLTIELNKFTTSYMDQNIDHKVIYSYFITCTDSAGNESAKSNRVSAMANDYKSTMELNFQGNYLKDKKAIQLSWNNLNSNEIKGYVVFKKLDQRWKPCSGLIRANEYHDIKFNSENSYKISVIGARGLLFNSLPISVSTN